MALHEVGAYQNIHCMKTYNNDISTITTYLPHATRQYLISHTYEYHHTPRMTIDVRVQHPEVWSHGAIDNDHFLTVLASDLLDKPWSQVSSLLPPGTYLQFLSHIGFTTPTARRLSSNIAKSSSRAFHQSTFLCKKKSLQVCALGEN